MVGYLWGGDQDWGFTLLLYYVNGTKRLYSFITCIMLNICFQCSGEGENRSLLDSVLFSRSSQWSPQE